MASTTPKTPRYKQGDLVMVPLRGLCEIVSAHEEEILGAVHLFYEMKPLADESILKIPSGQMAAQGIRPTMTQVAMEQLLDCEPDPCELPEGRPHQRLKRWVEILRSGDAGCRRRVLCMLNDLQDKGDKLSKSEQELQEKIRLAFRHEIETVLGLSAPQAGRRVNLALS